MRGDWLIWHLRLCVFYSCIFESVLVELFCLKSNAKYVVHSKLQQKMSELSQEEVSFSFNPLFSLVKHDHVRDLCLQCGIESNIAKYCWKACISYLKIDLMVYWKTITFVLVPICKKVSCFNSYVILLYSSILHHVLWVIAKF